MMLLTTVSQAEVIDSKDALGGSSLQCPGVISEPIGLRQALQLASKEQAQYLMALQDREKAKVGVIRAWSPFLPSAIATVENDRFKPTNGGSPAIVVGNSIVGGNGQGYTSYGAVSVNLNLYNGGRDVAGYRGSKALERASDATVDATLADTLQAVIVAYSDLFKAQLAVDQVGHTLTSLRAIQSTATARYRDGYGTTIAIGRARNDVLDADRQFYQACHGLRDKSDALVKAIGADVAPGKVLVAAHPVPAAKPEVTDADNIDTAVMQDPAVIAAQLQVQAAYAKVDQARGAFLPVVSAFAKKDFLGQSLSGFGSANGALAYQSYRVGVSVQQPLGPFTTEYAELETAKADALREEAALQQTIVDMRNRLHAALNTLLESRDATHAAQSSVEESHKLLDLTQSLYKAGRTASDSVEQARVDVQKSERLLGEQEADLRVARWRLARSINAEKFTKQVLEDAEVRF
ncbi:TolC family protein [Ralstonia pseudosolanacearum]|uniref:TolC family protein n=1 Tax=Ralstonia pseudosolanacearum TaxID=1310165 RepID=UPI0023DCC90C|nr:TolC family protein [Ralstonia pseudosolanacearum]